MFGYRSSGNTQGISDEAFAETRQNAYSYLYSEQTIFPNFQNAYGINQTLTTFDLSFNPHERGPYNFETEGVPGISAGSDGRGFLNQPDTRWGGLMRDLIYKNFESSNVEFVEFWMLDPFIYATGNPDSIGGDFFINLGNASEDVLKDGRQFFENSMPAPGESVPLDTTAWGLVSPIRPATDAFDVDPEARQAQDIGFDGLTDAQEQAWFSDYVSYLQSIRSIQTDAADIARLDSMIADPSSDNFRFFRNDYYTQLEENPDYPQNIHGISLVAQRYTDFNGSEGNSPVEQETGFTISGTNYPDNEDLFNDKALNDSEAYFEYRIRLEKDMQLGSTQYLADFRDVEITLNDQDTTVRFYYFRVPVAEYTGKVGELNLRNVEFIRMYLTDFNQPVICRMARLNLVRNTWRRYTASLFEEGEYQPDDNTSDAFFTLSAINIEENNSRQPIPYVLPPGIERVSLVTTTVSQLQNEQSLQVQVGN